MWGRLSLKWSCSNDLTTLAPMIRDSAPTDQNMQQFHRELNLATELEVSLLNSEL